MNTLLRSGKLAHESPAPAVDMTTSREMLASSNTAQTVLHESAKKRGGETCAAKGLSDFRTVLSVKMTAEGVRPGAAHRALRMSGLDRGDPVAMVSPARGARL